MKVVKVLEAHTLPFLEDLISKYNEIGYEVHGSIFPKDGKINVLMIKDSEQNGKK